MFRASNGRPLSVVLSSRLPSPDDSLNSQLNLDRFEILGYQLITDNRTFSSGGGVALYVKRDHTFKVRDDFKLPDIENIWIESADLVIAADAPAFKLHKL